MQKLIENIMELVKGLPEEILDKLKDEKPKDNNVS
jgi:hypothetical protein